MVLLTTPHHSASAYVLNIRGFLSFSARYMRNEEKMRPRKPMYNVVKSSWPPTKNTATALDRLPPGNHTTITSQLKCNFNVPAYVPRLRNQAVSMIRLSCPPVPYAGSGRSVGLAARKWQRLFRRFQDTR